MEEPNLYQKESHAEREQILWIASEQYMRGQITVSKLGEIEHPYNQDFERATIVLAKRTYLRRSIQVAMIFSIAILIVICLITFFLTHNQVALAILSVAITYSIIQKDFFPNHKRTKHRDTLKN